MPKHALIQLNVLDTRTADSMCKNCSVDSALYKRDLDVLLICDKLMPCGYASITMGVFTLSCTKLDCGNSLKGPNTA